MIKTVKTYSSSAKTMWNKNETRTKILRQLFVHEFISRKAISQGDNQSVYK